MKPARKPDPSSLPQPRSARAFSPEAMAKRAVSRKPTTPSGHRVKLTLTLFLLPDLAEYLIARAIREGKPVRQAFCNDRGRRSGTSRPDESGFY